MLEDILFDVEFLLELGSLNVFAFVAL